MSCECSEDGFDGPWWQYPPLRNGLVMGSFQRLLNV